jgi:hypothetical protein
MKKAKMVLLLAILFGAASAFTTSSPAKRNLNTYVAVYADDGSFHWELLQGAFNQCEENTERACAVQAESLPDANTKPAGYIPGEYIP